MLRHSLRGCAGAIAICLVLLAGCGAPQAPRGATATATTAPTATATAILATATVAVTSFTCTTQTLGSTKRFTDGSMQFAFSYPASWTEDLCQRFTGNDGQQTIMIGNLFSVTTTPRNGQTLQQWVNSQSNQYEIVTLGPLTVQQAQAAATITVNPSPISDPGRAFDAEPFSQAFAIVAGSHYFYQVNGFVAQMSMSDTMPNLTHEQMAQQVVTTFIVS